MTALPLSKLRVMPHDGSPVIVHGPWEHVPHFLLRDHKDGIVSVSAQGLGSRDVDARGVSLDLTAPTTPRIDGASVAATMLAEAAGLDVSYGVTWEAYPCAPGSVRVTVSARDPEGYPATSMFPRFPDNCESSATDPRDILAAVLLAVLGVTP